MFLLVLMLWQYHNCLLCCLFLFFIYFIHFNFYVTLSLFFRRCVCLIQLLFIAHCIIVVVAQQIPTHTYCIALHCIFSILRAPLHRCLIFLFFLLIFISVVFYFTTLFFNSSLIAIKCTTTKRKKDTCEKQEHTV